MTPRKVFYDELRSDFTLFLAYAAIMRACKRCPKVKAGQPVIIGLVLPDPGDHHIYERAAVLVAHGPGLYADKTTSDRHAVVLSSNFDTKDNKRVRILFGEVLKSYDRVLVLSDTAEALPEKFDATADAVVRVGRPDADLVLAAGRCCLGKTIVQKDAELLGMVPLREIKKHLRYDVPVEDWVAAIIGKPAMARLQAAQPRLEDLHGLGEAAEWGRELAIDLEDWKLGKIGWSEVDRGVLLSGAPGTGKTTFAGALARSCDAHLVVGSLGRWQAKGHLGDLLKAMRKAFDEAREHVPSIIFIDEIDAVGDREKFSGHNAQYSTEVVAALLECIDGLDRREGVVIVGACNHPARIDSALTRAGRLDRHVRIPLPDADARTGILRWHLNSDLADADLAEVVGRTDGWSGAALEKLVRDARRPARRERRLLALRDLTAALPTRLPIPDDCVLRSAVHEIGHVIVGCKVRVGEFTHVTIVRDINPEADTQPGGGAFFQEPFLPLAPKDQFLAKICTALAGIAAEETVFGNRSAGSGGIHGSDLHMATNWALMMEASYGFGERLLYLAENEEKELRTAMHLDSDLRRRAEGVLQEQFKRALEIVGQNRNVIRHLAKILVERGQMDAPMIADTLRQAGQSTDS